MYALSVLQPWAWLLFTPHKPVENRTWKLPARLIGERVYIHASKQDNPEEWQAASDLCDRLGIQLPPCVRMPHGAIFGSLVFCDDVTAHPSPMFCGPRGWLRRDCQLLPTPIPCRGALGFWRVPEEVEAEINRQRKEGK